MKLSTGAELTFDWEKISQAEWIAVLEDDGKTKITIDILEKLTGISANVLLSLNPIEYRKTVLFGMTRDYGKNFKLDDVKN